jgi:hypothetical protein
MFSLAYMVSPCCADSFSSILTSSRRPVLCPLTTLPSLATSRTVTSPAWRLRCGIVFSLETLSFVSPLCGVLPWLFYFYFLIRLCLPHCSVSCCCYVADFQGLGRGHLQRRRLAHRSRRGPYRWRRGRPHKLLRRNGRPDVRFLPLSQSFSFGCLLFYPVATLLVLGAHVKRFPGSISAR